MAFQWYPVPAFGGGLNLGVDPLSVQDDQWTWCNAVYPQNEMAQTAGQFKVICNAWMLGDHSHDYPIGWVPDLIRLDYPSILCFSADSLYTTVSARRVHFDWRTPGQVTPTVSNLPQVGPGTVAPDVYQYMPPPMTTSVTAAQQLVLIGVPYDPGNTLSGAFKYVADEQVYVLNGIKARHGCAASGHAVIAEVGPDVTNARTVKISDSGDIATWTPAISNSADFFTVDGGDSITGLVSVSGGFIVLAQRGLQVAQSTRQIPPFSIDQMQSRGAIGEGILTSQGAMYMTPAGLSNASATIVCPQIAPYFQAYHGIHVMREPAHDAVAITNGVKQEFLEVNVRTERAWRHTLPFPIYSAVAGTGPLVRHGVLTMLNPNTMWGAYPPISPMHLVMDLQTGYIWGQYGDNTPETSAFVDSKDFAFGAGTQIATVNAPGAMMTYVDRLKVQWESTATGALDVWAAVRNHFGSQGGTALPWQVDAESTLNWVKVGTLTAGLSELALRLKGKFFRFRFAVSNAQPFRIRGFAIRYLPAADLRKAA